MTLEHETAGPANPIHPIALTIRRDEACYGLFELDLMSPGNLGWNRYQIVIVNRNDSMAEFATDLGPRMLWPKAEQFRIPGAVQDDVSGKVESVHTVEELMHLADRLRGTPKQDIPFEPEDLVKGFADHAEQMRWARLEKDRSAPRKHSGPMLNMNGKVKA